MLATQRVLGYASSVLLVGLPRGSCVGTAFRLRHKLFGFVPQEDIPLPRLPVRIRCFRRAVRVAGSILQGRSRRTHRTERGGEEKGHVQESHGVG